MANGDIPAVQGSVPGELEMNGWLKKLKENQDRRKDEKLRRYNDIISKLIIILVGLLIICVIIIASLAVENNSLYRQNDQLGASYARNVSELNGQIATLKTDNDNLQQFIFSNRTSNAEYTVNVDPSLPKVNKVVFNNNRVYLYFVDGTSKGPIFFIDNDISVNR